MRWTFHDAIRECADLPAPLTDRLLRVHGEVDAAISAAKRYVRDHGMADLPPGPAEDSMRSPS